MGRWAAPRSGSSVSRVLVGDADHGALLPAMIPPGGIVPPASRPATAPRSGRLAADGSPRSSSSRSPTAPRAPPAEPPSRPGGSGSSPTATTSPSSSLRAAPAAARALGMALASAPGAAPDPRRRRRADARRVPEDAAATSRPITDADVEAIRRDLAAWDGDLVGWLDTLERRPAARHRSPIDDGAVRARQRGRDVADPRLLRRPLGVRAAHVPDPVEHRRATSSRASRRTSTCRTSTSTSR